MNNNGIRKLLLALRSDLSPSNQSASTLGNSSYKQLGCIKPEENDSSELHCLWKQSYDKHTPQPHAELPPADNHWKRKFEIKFGGANELYIIEWSNSSQIDPNMVDTRSQSIRRTLHLFQKKVKNKSLQQHCLQVTEDHLWHDWFSRYLCLSALP